MIKNNGRYKIKTSNGYEPFTGIQKVKNKDSIKFYLSNGEDIGCSYNHIFIVNDKEILASNLEIGNKLQTSTGYTEIISIEDSGFQDLYDIINAGKNYCYYTNDILSHNCKFLASTDSLITSEVVENMKFGEMIENDQIPFYDKLIRINSKFDKMINIYELPKKDHEYSIGVDPAQITEDSSGDSVALQILDVTELPFVQVGTIIIYEGVHYSELPFVIKLLGEVYNEALIFIENNDTIGVEIADALLLDHEYDNVFSEKAGVPGFRTTGKKKKLGCLNLKMLVETGKLRLNDIDTISQISTFTRKQNSYEAEKGYNDDAVMALIHSLVFLQDRMGYEHKRHLVDGIAQPKQKLIEKKKAEFNFEEPIEDPMPFGYSSTGYNNDNLKVF